MQPNNDSWSQNETGLQEEIIENEDSERVEVFEGKTSCTRENSNDLALIPPLWAEQGSTDQII